MLQNAPRLTSDLAAALRFALITALSRFSSPAFRNHEITQGSLPLGRPDVGSTIEAVIQKGAEELASRESESVIGKRIGPYR
jgi:hypothetical protein